LISWSRYLDQLQKQFDQRLDPQWTDSVRKMVQLLHSGSAIYQMMQVTGEEGITLEDFVTWQKATFLDMVYLQQDAFDPVDVSVTTDRQKESFLLIKRLIDRPYVFQNKDQARDYFTKLTGLYKNLNYSPSGSDAYHKYLAEIGELERQGVGGEMTSVLSGARPEKT
jgi:V/A-type H+-transporting ATPase subunit A